MFNNRPNNRLERLGFGFGFGYFASNNRKPKTIFRQLSDNRPNPQRASVPDSVRDTSELGEHGIRMSVNTFCSASYYSVVV